MRAQPRLTRRGAIALAIGALCLAILIGCAPFGGSAESSAPGFFSLAEDDMGDFEPALEQAERSVASTGLAADAQTDAQADGERGEPAERLRVFTGDLRLSVPRVDESRAQAIAYAEEIGGYVERSTADSVVVRVPAESFFEAFEALEALGDLLHRLVQTADVTDQYTDVERRLEIATRSRDRLYELLERAEDADERVAILREIRRLTEEVERLRSAIESLAELIAYSRITLQFVSRIQSDQVLRDRIPFSWIARLDPLSATIGEPERRLSLVVPDGFAAFENGRGVRAEAADGTRLRVGARENLPAGDAAFWADALGFHLEPFYRAAVREESGSWIGVRLESKDRDPFFYLVMVSVGGDELLVSEAFFPDAEAFDRHAATVFSMLSGEGDQE